MTTRDPDVALSGYEESRRSFGINVLGTLVVQVEADDGTVGFGVTTAGEPGAWIVERHLARSSRAPVTDIEKIWDQMYRSTLFYGRRGWCSTSSAPSTSPLRPAGQATAGTGLPPARRRGPRRADLLRHRGATGSGPADGLHRRQDGRCTTRRTRE